MGKTGLDILEVCLLIFSNCLLYSQRARKNETPKKTHSLGPYNSGLVSFNNIFDITSH